MYATVHEGTGVDHVHVTLEHGPHAGTWEVRYQSGAGWWVRSPVGTERSLSGSEPWIGDLGAEFAELVRKIAPHAVMEAIKQEEAARREVSVDPVGESWPEGVVGA